MRRKRAARYSQKTGSNKQPIFSCLEWRRGWDSNPTGPFGLCKLQISRCRQCHECQRCRGAVHAIARWLSYWVWSGIPVHSQAIGWDCHRSLSPLSSKTCDWSIHASHLPSKSSTGAWFDSRVAHHLPTLNSQLLLSHDWLAGAKAKGRFVPRLQPDCNGRRTLARWLR